MAIDGRYFIFQFLRCDSVQFSSVCEIILYAYNQETTGF